MKIKKALKEIIRRVMPEPKTVNGIAADLQELKAQQQDIYLRVRDIQDRTYDAIVQSRNQSSEVVNAIKLNALRQKIKEGKKVRVVFLNSFLEKFEIASVYWEMEKSELFEPVIFVMSERDLTFDKFPEFFEKAKKAYTYLTDKGYRTVFAYDENGNPMSLWDLNPDIIFYNNPQLIQYTEFPNSYINAVWLSCYTPYFMPMVKNEAYCYHNPFINSAWKVFCPTREFYREFVVRQNIHQTHLYSFNAYNAVFTGYPKLDAYQEPVRQENLPDGINNGNPIVIVAPHGNIRYDVNIATFHLYYQQLIDLLEKYPEVNFVFKPHPVLRRRLYNMVNSHLDVPMTPEEYDQYVENWCSYPNGFYVHDGEYIDLFKASSLLITDSGSFINEYLPSGHPCIYLLNPENPEEMDNFTASAKKILSTYYCCSAWEDAAQWFCNIIEKHEDPKRDQRLHMAETELHNIGGAGKRIVKHIEQCLKG